jgi:hypothetical protein
MASGALHEPVDRERPSSTALQQAETGPSVQEHGISGRNSDNGTDVAEYRDLWTPPFHPDTPWGDSTRPYPASALVLVEKQPATWHGPASRHGPGLYRQGVDIQQLRRQGRGSKQSSQKKLDVLPQRPSFHHSLHLINTSTSSRPVCSTPSFQLVSSSLAIPLQLTTSPSFLRTE